MNVDTDSITDTITNTTMNEYIYDEIKLENEYSAAFSVQITQELMDEFMSLSGDTNPLHVDSEFAKTVGTNRGYSQTELFTVCLLLLFIRVLQAYIFPESIVYFRG